MERRHRALSASKGESTALDRKGQDNHDLIRFRLAAIIESTSDAIIGEDLNGLITDWNKGAERLFGHAENEMLGASITCLMPPDLLSEEARVMEKIKRGETVENLETQRRTKDQRVVHVSVTVSPIKDEAGRVVGVSRVVRDITKQKNCEQELARLTRLFSALSQVNHAETSEDISRVMGDLAEQSTRREAEQAAENERRFSATMTESMPGIIYFYDEQGRFLRWNRNFEVISGYSREEIARMHPLDFFADEEKGLLRERIAEVFEKGESSVEASFVAKDGRATPYFFTGRRVRFGGQTCLVGVGVDVSERKQAEQRLSESERKYRELVQHAHSIILRWDAEGRIIFLNEFGQRFFGYTAEEIIGRSVLGTIVPATETSGRDLRRLMEEICADPAAFEQNINENMRRNGQRAWISWTNHIVRDRDGKAIEILSVGTDITEQRRADQALRRSEEQFRLIMENLADLVAVLDLKGNRLYNSPSYQAILGAPDRLVGSSSFEQIHPEDKERVRQAFEETARTGQGQRLEYRLIDQSGHSRHIESQGSVIRDAKGSVAQIVVVSRDVTERRQAEQVIRDLNANLERRVTERTVELEAALVRAEAADRLKSAFLATMSHELRTPLNSIIGFTGIVLQGMAGPINDEQKKQLGMVRGSARHLLELINDVLDLSKIEAGQLEVRAERFNLRESAEHVVASVRPLAEKRGLALFCEILSDPGEMISDRRRAEQILLNLVNNAIKFTDHGEVRVVVEGIHNYAPVAEQPPRAAARVRVLDTGIGIAPEDLQRLFQPFRQIDTGLARQHEGTGLGLAICRRLAGLLGGEISARSERAKGSEFTVIIPIQKPTPHEIRDCSDH